MLQDQKAHGVRTGENNRAIMSEKRLNTAFNNNAYAESNPRHARTNQGRDPSERTTEYPEISRIKVHMQNNTWLDGPISVP